MDLIVTTEMVRAKREASLQQKFKCVLSTVVVKIKSLPVNNGCEVSHENLAAAGQHNMLTIEADVCVLVNQAMKEASRRGRVTAILGHDDVDH